MFHQSRGVSSALMRWAFVATLLLGIGSSSVSAQFSEDRCIFDVVPLIQQTGLDVDKSAPALGCRQDEGGRWFMPTVADTADQSAYENLNPQGQQILQAIDRMSMDSAFASSMRFDRTRSVALLPGSGGTLDEIDISDVLLGLAPDWGNYVRDSYEESMMKHLTRTAGDEVELVYYLEWFMSRRDVTLSALSSGANPMAASGYLDAWGYQRAPWPWQLADPYAIAEFTGQMSLGSGSDDTSLPSSTLTPTSIPIPKDTGESSRASVPELEIVSLRVTPEHQRIPPGGSTLYFVQPYSLGHESTDFALDIEVPMGMTVLIDPWCGFELEHSQYYHFECVVEVESRSNGSTGIHVKGPILEDGIVTLYLEMGVDATVPVATELNVNVRLETGAYPAQDPAVLQSAKVNVSDAGGATSSDMDGAVGGNIEVRSGYTHYGERCRTDYFYPGLPIALYDANDYDSPALVATALGEGRLLPSSDGSGMNSCVFTFQFTDVPTMLVYILASYDVDSLGVSRANTIGQFQGGQNAENVRFVFD